MKLNWEKTEMNKSIYKNIPFMYINQTKYTYLCKIIYLFTYYFTHTHTQIYIYIIYIYVCVYICVCNLLFQMSKCEIQL